MKPYLTFLAVVALGTLAAATPVCGTAYAAACCKVCKAGKACGDSCISKKSTCTKGKGCACDG